MKSNTGVSIASKVATMLGSMNLSYGDRRHHVAPSTSTKRSPRTKYLPSARFSVAGCKGAKSMSCAQQKRGAITRANKRKHPKGSK